MSKDPIQWLRALEAAATPGPWEKYAVPANTMKDARLIAAARNLLPVLVEVVVQARQPWEVEKERLCSCCGNPVDDHLDNCALPKALAAIRAEQERQS